MTRTIDLSQFDADARVIAWLGENGIDANHVPAAQEITIDGDQLSYLAFTIEDGHKVIAYDERGNPFYRKEQLTATLVSAPETFGL